MTGFLLPSTEKSICFWISFIPLRLTGFLSNSKYPSNRAMPRAYEWLTRCSFPMSVFFKVLPWCSFPECWASGHTSKGRRGRGREVAAQRELVCQEDDSGEDIIYPLWLYPGWIIWLLNFFPTHSCHDSLKTMCLERWAKSLFDINVDIVGKYATKLLEMSL